MSEPQPRYCRVPVGFLDQALGLSQGAKLLLMHLVLSPSRKTLPGVLRIGIGGLKDELDVLEEEIRRHLDELIAANLIAFDPASRVLLVHGMIKADPPRNASSVGVFAKDFNELPPCDVRNAIYDEMCAAIARFEKSIHQEWVKLARHNGGHSAGHRGHAGRDTVSSTVPHARTRARPFPSPSPVPIPSPSPPPPPVPAADVAAAAAERVLVWNRLGTPFVRDDVNELEEDQQRELAAIPLDRWGKLVEKLQQSFYANPSGISSRPTLRTLLERPEQQQRILRGRDDRGQVGPFRCAECGSSHGAIGECPPPCRGCGERHPVEERCARLAELEAHERSEAEIKSHMETHGVGRDEAVEQIDAQKHAEYVRRFRGSA